MVLPAGGQSRESAPPSGPTFLVLQFSARLKKIEISTRTGALTVSDDQRCSSLARGSDLNHCGIRFGPLGKSWPVQVVLILQIPERTSGILVSVRAERSLKHINIAELVYCCHFTV